MSSVKWDSSVLKKVELLLEVNFDDAFAVVPIDNEIVKNFNFIMGVVPVLQAFIDRYHGKKIERLTAEEYLVRFPSSLFFRVLFIIITILLSFVLIVHCQRLEDSQDLLE
jgi:hypothetical protein